MNRIGEAGLDATAAESLIIRHDFYVTDGPVWATALSGNTLYIGGEFTHVGPCTGNGVPFDEASGAPVSGFPSVNGWVQAVAPDGSGGWYIGGYFFSVGGKPRQSLAHILPDNSVADWSPGFGEDVQDLGVEALAVSGGTVYVSGWVSAAGKGRRLLVAIDAGSGVLKDWAPNPDAAVRTLAVTGTTIYAGGDFSSIGGQARNQIAALDATTGLATDWNPDAGGYPVQALAVSGTTIYVAGFFTSIGGQSRNYLAALDATTGLATAWNPNPNHWVLDLAVSGRTVYAAGGFNSIGGQPRKYLAALDATTGLASGWDPSPNDWVYVVAASGPTVYAGGDYFTNIGGQPRNGLAALDAMTGLATAWDPSPNDDVLALAVGGGRVYVGGEFRSIAGKLRKHIAALDVTTGVATDWAPDADREVWALAASGTTVYAGGEFASIGGQTRNRIAALDATTGLATAWNPNAGEYGVWALAASGTTVYAGGAFTSIGGQARNRIAALDAATGLATGWDPGADGGVWVLKASGSVVYAGGYFHTIGGQTRNHIAAVDAATGLATAWDPNAGGGSWWDRTMRLGEAGEYDAVFALAVSGTTVYAGGGFTSIGGQARNGIAALDAATGLPTPWDPAAPYFNEVFGTVVYALGVAGTSAFAGGEFQWGVGPGEWRENLVALDATTGLVTDWQANPDDDVYALMVTGTAVYAGGGFRWVLPGACCDGWPQSGIVAIEEFTAPVALANVDLEPRVINLKSRGLWVTAHIEPVGFDPSSIVLPSVRLAGSLAPVEKFASIGDRDQDGAPDVMLKFSREGLDPLLKPGVNQLEVTGSLLTGGAFKGSCEVRAIAPPAERPTASLAPNPLNPMGVLTLRLPRPGAVTVRMFDLQGRLVRTLVGGSVLPAGLHRVRIDGRGQRGEALASGVYLYRVETPGEALTGRVAILK